MKYIVLYNYLRKHEELNGIQAMRSIMDVRRLAPEIKKGMATWSKTGTCDLVVAGVSFKELVTAMHMKPIRAFKMLDWLKREPAMAHRYLAQMTMRADLSKCGSAKVATGDNDTNNDKSDIEL